MRRTARDVQIDWPLSRKPIPDRLTTAKGTAGDRTRTHGDHDSRSRHGVVRLPERDAHVATHRASDHESIGMARGRYELHTKARKIKDDVAECDELRFAATAAPCDCVPSSHGAAVAAKRCSSHS